MTLHSTPPVQDTRGSHEAQQQTGHSRPRRSVCAPGALALSSNRKPDIQKRTTTMMFFSRKTRFRVSPKFSTAKPRLEPLEERMALSGFGTADGAYIVEPWIGAYSDVQVQPGDQKIMAAGNVNPNNNYTD